MIYFNRAFFQHQNQNKLKRDECTGKKPLEQIEGSKEENGSIFFFACEIPYLNNKDTSLLGEKLQI